MFFVSVVGDIVRCWVFIVLIWLFPLGYLYLSNFTPESEFQLLLKTDVFVIAFILMLCFNFSFVFIFGGTSFHGNEE